MKRTVSFILLILSLGLNNPLEGQVETKGFDPSVFLEDEGLKDSVREAPLTALQVKVTRDEMADKPISRLLPGYLFEMGYGDMETGMWGEMLFNRQFEPFSPYKPNHDWWYELRDRAPGGFTNLTTVDWRVMSWYHSSYEHNSWYPAPGEVNDHVIHESSSFLHTESGKAVENLIGKQSGSLFVDGRRPSTIKLSRIKSGNRPGYLVRIHNQEVALEGGLAQNGKYLKAGMAYQFSGRIRRVVGDDQVKICLFKEKDWSTPLAEVEIDGLTVEFKHIEAVLQNTDYEGVASFAIYIPPGSVVDVELLSLMPEDVLGGWRKDVIEMVRDQVKPGALRWPGGIFASFYDWRDGVGEPDNRPVNPSYHWGGYSFNDVGTLEYYKFCQETGAEPFICLNLFHPSKEVYSYLGKNDAPMQVHGYHLPQFTDLEKGAKLAADWVAYCNAPAGSHPMADLRVKHGHPEPLRIKYWELENEAFRFFQTAEEYAKACVVYSGAMKAVDPGIKLGMCTYGDHLSNGLEHMLEIAGKHVDFLADRGTGYGNIARKISIAKEYGKKNKRDIAYANTEYFLSTASSKDVYDQILEESGSRNLKHASWAYALDWASKLMQWQRFGGDVIFTSYNSFVNDHMHSVFDTPREGAFIRYPAAIGKLFRDTPAAWPLELENYLPDSDQPLQVQLAWNMDRTQLVIYVLNYLDHPGEVSLDLSDLNQEFNTLCSTILSGPELSSIRSVKTPNPMVCEQNLTEEDLAIKGKWSLLAPPASFMQIILK